MTRVICLEAMSDAEDDYLADLDKFLVASNTSTPKTYSELRKDAQRRSKLKNESNKLKGRRQRELEAREEGLSKSLFERAKEEEAAGVGSGNKALSIMMKMGFKPGESLGKADNVNAGESEKALSSEASTGSSHTASGSQHKTEPLPLNEWAGSATLFLCFFTS